MNGLLLTYSLVGDDHHDVRVGREEVNDDGIVGVLDLHRLKGRVEFVAAELEVFDDVADLFEAFRIVLLLLEKVRDDEERGLFEQ